MELVSVTLNGQEFSVLTAMQMGYSIARIPQDNNTFAYILRVPFDDSVVKKLVRLFLLIKSPWLRLIAVT